MKDFELEMFLHNTSTNVFSFRAALKQFILYCASTVTETKQELVLGTEDKQIYFSILTVLCCSVPENFISSLTIFGHYILSDFNFQGDSAGNTSHTKTNFHGETAAQKLISKSDSILDLK